MIKKHVFLFISFFLVSSGFAQVEFQPKTYSYGKVRPGQSYELKVKVTNTSSATITFSAPVPVASGITAALGKNVLKPKAFTDLTLTYKPDGAGKGNQFLRILLNVSSKKKGRVVSEQEEFQAKAFIDPFYVLIPEKMQISYMNGEKVGNIKGKFTVDKAVFPHWKLVKADTDSNSLDAQVKPTKDTYDFSVDLSIKKSLLPGVYNGVVTIEGMAEKATTLEYPYQIIVGSIWNIEPHTLNVGELNPQKLENWKILMQVRQVYGKPFEIEKIDQVPAWLNYKTEKTSWGYLIHWDLDLEKLKDKDEMKKSINPMILCTNYTDEKNAEVPLNAFWLRAKAVSAWVSPKATKIPWSKLPPVKARANN